jgi:hypothetical protein
MMKKILPVICLAVITLVLPLISACSSGDITTALGKEFTLPAGKTARITGESLWVKFVEVTGDSRCPTGVQCIQAGDAKCLMLINYNDSQSSLTFTQLGGNDVNVMDFNVYKFTFTLEPYPVYPKQIEPDDYKLIMTVTKATK